ncbi:MAG: CapA family protein [candidate division WOR-3 bacterium]|nr:CapA family protein [candidate division WOR-3 bacterium]
MKRFYVILSFIVPIIIAAGELTIAAVGDIMPANTFNEDKFPAENGKYLFTDALEILQNADIAIGNLECALLDTGQTRKDTTKGTVYVFRTPEVYARTLKETGFDAMNLANNHARDFGDYGLERTKLMLDSAGIQYTGFPGRLAGYRKGDITIAVIGFSVYHGMNNLTDIEKSSSIIEDLNEQYDIIIVTFHGGMESRDTLHTADTTEYYYGENRGNIVKFSRAVIDAGADLVIGHGPHVPRAMEIYKDRLIAYSLGNFLTYTNVNTRGIAGYAPLLTVTLADNGSFIEGKIHSFYQKKWHGVRHDSSNSAFNLIKKLSLEDFPNSAPNFTDNNKFLK